MVGTYTSNTSMQNFGMTQFSVRMSSTNLTEHQNNVQNRLPSLTNNFSNADEWRIIPTTKRNQPSPQNDNEVKQNPSSLNFIARTSHLNSPSLVANVGKVSNKFSQENEKNGRIVVGKERKIPISILEDVIIDTVHWKTL